MRKILLPLLLVAAASAFADDLERSVAMMAKIGYATSPVLSPDAKRVAFISNINGVPQLWTIAAEGGWPDQATALDDPVSSPEWSPDGRWLSIVVLPGGGLNSQIYVVRPDGTGLRRLTEGGKENNWAGRWTPDSKAIVFSSNRRSGAAMDTWSVDVASGKPTMVAQGEGISTVNEISEDGKYALVNRLRSRGDNDVYRVSLTGGGETLLTKHTPPAEFGDVHFAAGRNDVIYIVGNDGRDFAALSRMKIDDKGVVSKPEVIASRADADLDSFDLSHDGSTAALDWNVGGRSEITIMEMGSGKQGPIANLPADIAGNFDFSHDGSKAVVALAGSAAPQDIWLVDVAAGTLKQLTRSPHPGVDLSSLIRPELVTYKADDGLTLSGWLYRPRDAKPPYPTVFSFHGGPEGQERPSFSSTYQALLANGMAVFAPNVRGSAGFGKKFVNLDNGALRVNGVRDIKASTDYLVKEGIADPKRMAIMGGSYGGYMVMAGVTEYPDLFAAGADLFGVVNFETFFAQSEPWMAAISTIEYGDPATQRDMLRSLSPIHKVDRVKTPLIVLHGANDTNVPVVEAEQVVSSLKQRNIPVEYILFPDEGHGWRKTPNRIKSTVAITRFFKERLAAR